MNIDTFLIECSIRGYCISLEGDSIRVTGEPKQATVNFIRQHKQEIIRVLSDQQHGACVDCGHDTANVLTAPSKPQCWKCLDCFDQEHAAHSKNATASIV